MNIRVRALRACFVWLNRKGYTADHVLKDLRSPDRPGPRYQGVQQDGERDWGPRLTPHGLRHAFATAALETRIDPQIAPQHLEHASVSTTYDIYAYVIPELETESDNKIEARLFGK